VAGVVVGRGGGGSTQPVCRYAVMADTSTE
jgi:hypothetical protein